VMGRVVKEDKRVDGDLYAAAGEALAEAAFRSGDFGVAEGLYQRAAAEAGDRAGEARAIGGLGMTHHYRNIAVLIDGGTVPGDAVDAEEELMRRSLELWRGTDDAAGTGAALFGVGLVMQVLRRDWDAAMTYFWPAFGLAEAVADAGDLYGCSEIHRHIGFYYLVADVRPREAVRRLDRSLELREQLGDPRRIPSGLVALGEAELAAGNRRRAVELLTRAVAVAREANLHPGRIKDAENALSEA
jgi:tetratricopeptide (TPR) repeat protein